MIRTRLFLDMCNTSAHEIGATEDIIIYFLNVGNAMQHLREMLSTIKISVLPNLQDTEDQLTH